jgi:hypothetical protein
VKTCCELRGGVRYVDCQTWSERVRVRAFNPRKALLGAPSLSWAARLCLLSVGVGQSGLRRSLTDAITFTAGTSADGSGDLCSSDACALRGHTFVSRDPGDHREGPASLLTALAPRL